MDGDGMSDLVAWSADGVSFATSTGSAFASPRSWLSSQPPVGARANVAARVD
jgi:hypothetical protein